MPLIVDTISLYFALIKQIPSRSKPTIIISFFNKDKVFVFVVQQSFFKHNDTIYDDWALSYYNKPMAGVSGDFLDIYGILNNSMNYW